MQAGSPHHNYRYHYPNGKRYRLPVCPSIFSFITANIKEKCGNSGDYHPKNAKRFS